MWNAFCRFVMVNDIRLIDIIIRRIIMNDSEYARDDFDEFDDDEYYD